MDERIKGIAKCLVREALYGWYNKRDEDKGDEPTAVMRAYYILMFYVRKNDTELGYMAREITSGILMAYWGRSVSNMELVGDRFRRAQLETGKALKACIANTNKRRWVY